jgi:prevent-host-death family protein
MYKFKLNKFLLEKEIGSLTDFKRKTSKHVRRLKSSQAPLILTVNGRAKLVVLDARAYKRLMEHVDKLETLDAIRRGLQDAAAGRGRPAKEFMDEFRRKHKLPATA